MDNIAPLIDITFPTGESVNSGIVDFTGEISDQNIDQYSIKYGYGIEPTRWWDLTSDSVSTTGTIYSWDTPNVKDGYYTIKLDAIDKAGNSSNREFVMTIDNAPAIAKIHEPTANQVVKGTVAISGIACDADFTTYNFEKYEISVGTGLVPVQWTTIESLVVPKINETLTNWNTAALADGTYTIKLKSEDISGVTETTRTVIVDNTDPTVSITSPTQGQTVSGSVSITGTASDTNLSEYKVYYKHTDSSIWTEIGSGISSLVATSLATWNTIDVGDGSYSIKLWIRDQAGNEKEIARDLTVNNVLAVVKDSASPATISPNGDGVDDTAEISYVLSETTPVTVKIYKKPAYDKFKWEAKGYGTNYPIQSFTYTIAASAKNYPAQEFGWEVNASGTETYSFSKSGSIGGSNFGSEAWESKNIAYSASLHEAWIDGGSYGPLYKSSGWGGGELSTGVYRLKRKVFFGANINYGSSFINVPDPTITISGARVKTAPAATIYEKTTTGCKAKFIMRGYITEGSGSDYRVWNEDWLLQPSEVSFNWDVSGQRLQPVDDSDSGTATIKRGNIFISGNRNYSVTLSPLDGGTISGHSISYSQTSNAGGVSSSRDTSGWGNNTCSGVINAAYIYAGDNWAASDIKPRSCGALDGTATVSNTMTAVFGAPNVHPDYREYSGFSVSDNNPNVSVWFNNSGTTSTPDTNDYLRALTTYSESWDTSLDPAVGSGGWKKSGEISLPFNFDESSQSFSTEYTPPSDVVLSSWTVNLKNPDGGAIADVLLDGTPTADGNFQVKISDSLLVKTLQHNASTTPGNQTIEWDGRDAGGNYVADGEYIYYIYAGPNIVKKSGVIKVQKSSEISAFSVSDNYISPNGDGVKENIAINYSLSETASVNIEVSDSAGTIVKSFSAPGNQGANSTFWDGTNDSSSVVEDGEYTIKIKANNANGALRTQELTVIVDNNSLTAGEVAAEQLVFSGYDPVYSPDKSKIAYAKEVSGKKQIHTLNLSNYEVSETSSVVICF